MTVLGFTFPPVGERKHGTLRLDLTFIFGMPIYLVARTVCGIRRISLRI